MSWGVCATLGSKSGIAYTVFFLSTAGCLFQSLSLHCPSPWPTVCRLKAPPASTAPWCSVSAPTLYSTSRTLSTARGATALQFCCTRRGTPGCVLRSRAATTIKPFPSALCQTTQVNTESSIKACLYQSNKTMCPREFGRGKTLVK